MKGPALLNRRWLRNSENTLTKFKGLLHQSILGWREFKFVQMKKINSHKENNGFFLLTINITIIICVCWIELFSQVSDVAHGPLVNGFCLHFNIVTVLNSHINIFLAIMVDHLKKRNWHVHLLCCSPSQKLHRYGEDSYPQSNEKQLPQEVPWLVTNQVFLRTKCHIWCHWL